MKKITKKISIAFSIFILSSLMGANASLIGTDVTLGLISVEQGSDEINFIADDVLSNPISVTVEEGEAETTDFIDGFLVIDIEAETLGILFPGGIIIDDEVLSLNDALGFGPLDFIGILFADLSFGADSTAEIVGITNLQSNIDGLSESNVLFDASNVAVNILDLAIGAQSFVIFDLVLEEDVAEVVNSPSVVVLFLLSLVALRFSRKS